MANSSEKANKAFGSTNAVVSPIQRRKMVGKNKQYQNR